jgi:hypothetical protein
MNRWRWWDLCGFGAVAVFTAVAVWLAVWG